MLDAGTKCACVEPDAHRGNREQHRISPGRRAQSRAAVRGATGQSHGPMSDMNGLIGLGVRVAAAPD